MGRGGVPYLCYSALLLLSAAGHTSASIWSINIDESPAPSPEDGPPFSAHATRNRDLLPYQIIGILAAYLGFMLILGTMLLTVGRRLRKQALSAAERPTKMVQPLMMLLSGQSPAHTRGGPFSRLRRQPSQASSMRSKVSGVVSPLDSTLNFDLDVIEEDKKRNQEALANVYDVIYETEDQKTQQISIQTAEQQRVPAIAIPQPPRRAPTHLRVDADTIHRTDLQPRSPHTPISPSVRAIYPPLPGLSNYEPPESPVRTRKGGSMELRNSQQGDYSSSPPRHLRGKLARDRLKKGLRISAPLRDDNSDGARTPLSPRVYVDPGIPPEPPSAQTIDSQWQDRSPATMRSWRQGDDYESYDWVERPREMPLEHPQRAFKVDGLPLSPNRSIRPLASPQSKRAANGSGALPLRQFTDQQRATPTSPANTRNAYPVSPGLASPRIRHNEIDFDARDLRRGLPSGKVPYTANATPYSAYFPGQKVEPMTPHLTTRAERLQKEKEEKALRGAIAEEDLVKDEGELWKDAYR